MPKLTVSRRRRAHRTPRWLRHGHLPALMITAVVCVIGNVSYGLTGAGLAAITTTSNTVASGPWATSTWSAGSATYNDDTDGSVTLNAVGNQNLAAYCVSANYTGTNPTSGWTDPFTTLDTTTRWTNLDPTNITLNAGRVRIAPAQPTIPLLASTSTLNFTHSSLSAKVVVPGQNNGGAGLDARVNDGTPEGDPDNAVSMFYYDTGNVLSMNEYSGGVRHYYDIDYDPVAMAYWRILALGQHLSYQYSANGTTWTTGWTYTTTLNLNVMKISVSSEGIYNGHYAYVDDLAYTQYTHSGITTATSGALAPNLNLTVERGTGGGNGSCAGFTPSSTVYTGPMSGLPTTFTSGLDPTNNPASTVYRISGTVPSLSTQRAAATFTWHAQVGANTTSTWSDPNPTYTDTTPGSLTLNALGTGAIAAYCIKPTYTGTRATSGWTDGFTTLDTTTRWNDWSAGNASIVGGALRIGTVAGPGSYTSIVSKTAMNFTNSTTSVKVANVPGGGGEAWLEIRANAATDYANRLAIWYHGPTNELLMHNTVAGVTTSHTLTYNAATMLYWRISINGTTVTYSYSANGTTWTPEWSPSTSLDLSNAYAMLETGAASSVSNPKYATFDDFTYTPQPVAKLYATTTGSLAADTTITIERGTGAGNGSCTGFTPTTTVYTGPLSGLPTTYATGLDPTTLTTSPHTTNYRISATISPTSTKRCTTTLTWATQ